LYFAKIFYINYDCDCDCAEIYVSFRYDERLSFMTNCSGGAIFPEIEISLRTSGSINIAAKETRLGKLTNWRAPFPRRFYRDWLIR